MVYLVMFLLLALVVVIAASFRINKFLVLRCLELKEKLTDAEKLLTELQYVSSLEEVDDLDEAIDDFNRWYAKQDPKPYGYVNPAELPLEPAAESEWEEEDYEKWFNSTCTIEEVEHDHPSSAKLYAMDYSSNK